MKALFLIVLGCLCVNAIPKDLLGSKECTWGPSYWCSNLTAAAGCHAVKHCIQTVWEVQKYPEDNDSVCQTCLQMVKQARDQLESNETQEEIKEVFDGSCKLIPIKVVNEECCKLADQFIPELIDTLASQMNPQVVCSVAGLCNNAKIDALLEEKSKALAVKPTQQIDTCTGCHTVVDILENKFNVMNKDDFLQSLLHFCGRLSSLSDACSNIVITYFAEIYQHMKDNFNSNDVCLLSGECSANFHVHKVEITPLSNIGVVPVNGDDLPCELCVQLVGHLKELLIANTTREEFKTVLEGLCKQTEGFKDECLSIVGEYYEVIYSFLSNELNGATACKVIGICPNSEKVHAITPLLPVGTLPKVQQIKEQLSAHVPINPSTIKVISKPTITFESQPPELMQLPIERLNSPHLNNVYSKELCVFCEYFLHYVQQAITNPRTEDNIRDVIDKACEHLPSSINETCVQFVDAYEPALVAILAEEIDPSTICPLIRVCPSSKSSDIEVFMEGSGKDQPNCPLCLFAVTKLEEMIKDHKTKENIKDALSKLCSHLSGNLAMECNDFVANYTDELVEMLADDFKPQEVCVYLKVCTDNKPAPKLTDMHFGGEILTNEILDFTANGKLMKPVNQGSKPECALCEFFMEKLETALEDKHTEDEIKVAIHSVCNIMPKTIKQDCNDFVDKYAEAVLDMIVANAKPEEICAILDLCDKKVEVSKEVTGGPVCAVCKLVIAQIKNIVGTNFTRHDVEVAMEKVCYMVPMSSRKDCIAFIDKNSDKIYDALKIAESPEILCDLMALCMNHKQEAVKVHVDKCAVCETTVMIIDKILQNSKIDHSIEHVLEKACRALPTKNQNQCKALIEEYGNTIFALVNHISDKSLVCKEIGLCNSENVFVRTTRQVMLVGGNKCTWGPSHWCENEENAKECGAGAYTHCNEKVWKGNIPK